MQLFFTREEINYMQLWAVRDKKKKEVSERIEMIIMIMNELQNGVYLHFSLINKMISFIYNFNVIQQVN